MTKLQLLMVCAALLTGCGEFHGGGEGGPLHNPGKACIDCHDGSGEAPKWTAAGTVFPTSDAAVTSGLSGATVKLLDDSGNVLVTLTSNASGNFYTRTTLPTSFHVQVEHNGQSVAMSAVPANGNCNNCHNQPPQNSAPGRITAPQ